MAGCPLTSRNVDFDIDRVIYRSRRMDSLATFTHQTAIIIGYRMRELESGTDRIAGLIWQAGNWR